MVVRLPGDNPEIFQIFAEFLYDGRIHSTKATDKVPDAEHPGRVDAEWERLARCWILGDKLNCVWFQDASIDAIVQKIMETDRVPKNLHTLVYSHTTGDNPLKQLVVDIAAWRYSRDDFLNLDSDCDLELSRFFCDTIARLHKRCNMRKSTTTPGPGDEPWYESGSDPYHLHCFASKLPCYEGPVILGGSR